MCFIYDVECTFPILSVPCNAEELYVTALELPERVSGSRCVCNRDEPDSPMPAPPEFSAPSPLLHTTELEAHEPALEAIEGNKASLAHRPMTAYKFGHKHWTEYSFERNSIVMQYYCVYIEELALYWFYARLTLTSAYSWWLTSHYYSLKQSIVTYNLVLLGSFILKVR